MKLHRDKEWLLFNQETDAYSWHGVLLLLAIYFGAMAFAALVAPPVYWAVLALAEGSTNGTLTYLAGKGFEDYFDRLRWVPVLLGLPWILKTCGLLSLRRLGWSWDKAAWQRFLKWFAVGAVLLGVIAIAQACFEQVEWREKNDAGRIAGVILKSLLGGLLLGFIEETVFRGLIFRLFYTALRPLPGMVMASLFFAYVHFKNIPSALEETLREQVTWGDGWLVAGWTAIGIFQDFEWLRFLNLFALGMLLCLLLMKTRSLMACAGLHAGAVAVMLTYKRLFAIESNSLFWGGGQITDGLFTLVCISAIAVIVLGNVWEFAKKQK